MKLGFLGLGKMGKNMVLRLLENRIEVVAWNRTLEIVDEVVPFGAVKAESVEDLVSKLETPRIIWLMLPQGQVVDDILSQLSPLLSKGDLIVDGGNSYYEDTLRRYNELSQKGLEFMDVGVSGGPDGARNGACLMIGGSVENFKRIEKIVIAASAPQSFEHLGPVGAGHFAKMVHNGIEYGMMQAIGEGAVVLKKSPFNYNLAQVFNIYNHKSVIESRLTIWAQEALIDDENLSQISSKINATGEGEWTIKTAEKLGVDVPVIKKSFEVRQKSKEGQQNFSNKMVSALRGKFGHHKVHI